MLENMRDNLISGLGAVLLTREKIEEVTRQLVEEARLSRRDAKRLAEELYRAGNQQWTSVEKSVKDAVRRTLSNMDVGSRQELEKLKAEVDKLQIRVDLLEDILDAEEKK